MPIVALEMYRSRRVLCRKVLLLLLIMGTSTPYVIQRASAMSQVKKSTSGEVLTESSSGPLHCEIVTNTESRNLQLRGVVWSGNHAAGSYRFIVTKQGSSGTSNIAQSGLFDVGPQERRVVGMVVVNALAGDRYQARLSVQSNGNETACDTALE